MNATSEVIGFSAGELWTFDRQAHTHAHTLTHTLALAQTAVIY